MNWFNSTIFTLSMFLVSGCITLGQKEAPKSPDTLAAAAAGDNIVQQGARKTPVVSKFGRDYWLDIRAGASSSIMRMHASLATGESVGAEDLARNYLQKHPGDVNGLTVLAASLVMQKKYHLANYYAKQLEKTNPGNAIALNIRGLAIMIGQTNRMKDFRQAESLFKAAFDENGEQVAPGLNLGHLQLELGNAKGAAATFGEVAKRCDHCDAALMGQGIAESRAGSKETAVAAFEEILDKNPNDSEALFHLALVHKNRYNNGEKAQELLHQLLSRSRRNDAATIALKERADSILNTIRGEASREERTAIARTEEADGEQSPNGAEDAEALMTSDVLED